MNLGFLLGVLGGIGVESNNGRWGVSRRRAVSLALRIPISVILLEFVTTVVQTVFADLLLRRPESHETLIGLANPNLIYIDPHGMGWEVARLYWVPSATFALICVVLPKWRLSAFLGALAGYLFGWYFFAETYFTSPLIFWPWTYRVVAIASAATLTFTLFEPILEVCEVWLSRPRQFVLLAFGAGAVGAALAYPAAVDYVDDRVAFRIDRQHLADTYRAIVLYETDHDGEAPKSLPDLVPHYLADRQLQSPKDARPGGNPDGYPADLYVFRRREYAHYVPFRVSYAYARSFERALIVGTSWEELRSKPDYGLLANLQHCTPASPPLERRLSLFAPITPDIMKDHGPATERGPYMRITMDGSLHVLQKKAFGVGDIPERLFYSWY